MTALAHSPVAQALAWTLLHFVWQGAAIAGALALLLRALSRESAAAIMPATAARIAAERGIRDHAEHRLFQAT